MKTHQFMFSVTLNAVKSLRSFASLRMTSYLSFCYFSHTLSFPVPRFNKTNSNAALLPQKILARESVKNKKDIIPRLIKNK